MHFDASDIFSLKQSQEFFPFSMCFYSGGNIIEFLICPILGFPDLVQHLGYLRVNPFRRRRNLYSDSLIHNLINFP
ncbi:Uncharacterised protein [Mycobacteroides abscessus subsp. massiliense]|nr:Uncharacterised protein [Mycobacteroides abscessus subsp. massiliense]